jgi:hypothetical protein
LIAVAPSHQVTDLVQTHRCRSLPLISTRDIPQPFQSTGHSSFAASSTPLSSAITSASNSSTRRMRRRREWWGDEYGRLVAPDMESTGDVARTGSAGRPSNGVAPISASTASAPGAAGALFNVGLTGTILPKQHLEFLRAQPGVGGNRAHGVRVDGVVSGNREAHVAVGHDDVLPLPQDHEAGFFQCADGLVLADAGYLWHGVRP